MQDIDIADENGNVKPNAFWYLINTYFEENGLVKQQLSSYNNFINKIVLEGLTNSFKFKIDNSDKLGINVSDEETHSIELINPKIHFSKTKATEPPSLLYPHEARLRSLSYLSKYDVIIQDTVSKQGIQNEIYDKKVEIGEIPVMVKSKICKLSKSNQTSQELTRHDECIFDQGGYFIINGSEKVVIAQEKMAPNTVLVFEGSDQTKYLYEGNINSIAINDDIRSHKIRMDYQKYSNNKIKVPVITMSKMDCDVPIILLFVALGFQSDQSIIDAICFDERDNEMYNIITTSIQNNQYTTIDSARQWIGQHSTFTRKGGIEIITENIEKLKRYGTDKLKKDLLPHIGIDNFEAKAQFLGYMTYHFLSVLTGKRNADDRDHLARKRMQMTGSLMTDLFKNSLKRIVKTARVVLQNSLSSRKDLDLTSAFTTQSLTVDFKKALSTGNWPQPHGKEPRHGVAQVLSRITFTSSLSYLRKISSPVEGKRKTQKPRQLHNTQWGYICPAETPEGEQCGLVKMLSLMAQITVALPNEQVNEIKESLSGEYIIDIKDCLGEKMNSITKVFLNGSWLKCTDEPQNLLEQLKNYRKDSSKGRIKKVMSMVLDQLNKELRIYTDSGRCTRPLFTVSYKEGEYKLNLKPSHITEMLRKNQLINERQDRNKSKSWKGFLSNGIVEYVDADEEEMAMIAMFPSDLINKENNESFKSYTHCEINPALVMGILGGIIPFPDHNQSPRNTYQCAMGKQAIGVYASNYQLRMDTLGHVLFYPQKPLVSTHGAEYVKFGYIPAGINAIVAICCYSGYNQEDSVMMNQGSIDRGFFRSLSFKTFSEECKKNGEANLMFFKPCDGITDLNEDFLKYEKLDNDGIILPGTTIKPDEIMIGSFYETKNNKLKDCSVRFKPREPGIIDQVIVTTNESFGKYIRVKIRTIRIPQIGDKFSSRHGQKGTIGMTYRQEDMPFTIEGITPDIIMNPHAIPSRMTVGQLVECLLGKVAALNGKVEDATPFQEDVTVEKISSRLHKLGYQKNGYEALFNGFTGRKLDSLVYIGPTYYQRLKHLVDDKVHGRATGPCATLTRQPLEGRSRDGGLRLGEMERDCMISHGVSALLKERLFLASDRYQIYICDKCHMPAVANAKSFTFECSCCKDRTHISKIEIPYAAKLLFQELMSMAICPRIYAEI